MRPMLRAAASRTAADRRVAGRRDVGGGGGARDSREKSERKVGKAWENEGENDRRRSGRKRVPGTEGKVRKS